MEGRSHCGVEFRVNVELGGVEPVRTSSELSILNAIRQLNQALKGDAFGHETSVLQIDHHFGPVQLLGNRLGRSDRNRRVYRRLKIRVAGLRLRTTGCGGKQANCY